MSLTESRKGGIGLDICSTAARLLAERKEGGREMVIHSHTDVGRSFKEGGEAM